MNKKLKKYLLINTIVSLLFIVGLFLLERFHECSGDECIICASISISYIVTSFILFLSFVPLISISISELLIKNNPNIEIKKDCIYKRNLELENIYISNNSLHSLGVRLQ